MAVFATAFVVAGVVVPQQTAQSRAAETDDTPERDKSRTAAVDGLHVTLDGTLTAGEESTLRFEVARDGRPVTVQPYLGADGHLVALRQGDLGYLPAHPLLYLDFRVDDTVHTAEFVVDGDGHDHGV